VSRPRRVLRVRALAKINLTLQVLGTRPDGYHNLRTTFQSIALGDVLTFKAAGDFRIECGDPACPADRTNLVWRAAEALWRAAGRVGEPPGVHVRIRKRIPVQAGLGGGSSDAAAALRACASIWRLRKTVVRNVAPTLGADVPFFLEGGTVLGVERGDLLFPLVDRPASWVVIVLPDFGVSTKDAYGWFDEGAASGALREASNDLEAAVARHHPEIGLIVRDLGRAGAVRAALSGSGSAVFGLFGHRRAAHEAAARLARRRRRVLVTRTVNRRDYWRLSRLE